MFAAVLLAAACTHTPLFTTGGIAQDEYAVYSVAADGHRILRLFKSGGSATVVESPFAITAIDVDGPRVYYALDSIPLRQIRVISITGGAPAVLANTSALVTQIAHDSAAIFWREAPETSEQALWRYDKRSALTEFVDSARSITRAGEEAIYYFLGPPQSGALLWRNEIHLHTYSFFGDVLNAGEPFVDDSAIYFRRGDALWRQDKNGVSAVIVDLLPKDAHFLGVAANRLFTSAGAIDLCSRETTPAGTRVAVDSCAIYEVVDDHLSATPIDGPRIDATLPAAARPGQLVRLLGDGFDRLATVTVGGVEAAVVSASERELDLLVPSIAVGGTTVRVQNRDSRCAAAYFNVAAVQ